jgi:hypothetical protein
MHFALQHAVQVVLCMRLSARALYMESIEHLLPSERRWFDGAAERVAGKLGLVECNALRVETLRGGVQYIGSFEHTADSLCTNKIDSTNAAYY